MEVASVSNTRSTSNLDVSVLVEHVVVLVDVGVEVAIVSERRRRRKGRRWHANDSRFSKCEYANSAVLR